MDENELLNLPPLPNDNLSGEERLRWIAWGQQCVRTGRNAGLDVAIGMLQPLRHTGENGLNSAYFDILRSSLVNMKRG
jgi:hypothetical protein